MPILKRALLCSILAVTATVLVVKSYQLRTADDNSAKATYSHGTLRVNLPYTATRAGGGQLTVDILDPEDTAVGHAEKSAGVVQGPGSWREDVKLNTPLAIEDLMWHRVRYRFTYG